MNKDNAEPKVKIQRLIKLGRLRLLVEKLDEIPSLANRQKEINLGLALTTELKEEKVHKKRQQQFIMYNQKCLLL